VPLPSNTSDEELPISTLRLSNRTRKDYVVPLRGTVHREETATITDRGHLQFNTRINGPNVPTDVRADITATQTVSGNQREEWHLDNMPVPEAGEVKVRRVERRMSRSLEVRAQASYEFHVYPGWFVHRGAALGGAVGGAGGVVGGAALGGVIGGVTGFALGPLGAVAGAIVGTVGGAAAGGTAVGAGAGGVGAGVGAGVGRAVQIQRVFTITARDVFQHLPGFREDKEQKLVYCQIRDSHSWEEMAYSIEQSQHGAD